MAHTPRFTYKDRPYYCYTDQGDVSLWHCDDSLHAISLCTCMMFECECDEYHRVISICVFALTKLALLTDMMGAEKWKRQAYMCHIFDKSQRNKNNRAIWHDMPFRHLWPTAPHLMPFKHDLPYTLPRPGIMYWLNSSSNIYQMKINGQWFYEGNE